MSQELNLADWVGRSETVEDVATATPYAALSATMDWQAERPASGTPLPALWHWLYFLPLARQSEIGPDGHPKRGGFLPPVPLPRRMWAGSDFIFHQPLQIGDTLARTSTIVDVKEKSGRTGTLLLDRKSTRLNSSHHG
jgi:3-methylfumaryl-CoA hydratase